MTPNPAETLPALQSQPLLQQSAPSQFFGDPTGQQMGALGQGLVSAARTASYLQDKLDESQARDMTIELGKMQGSLLVDPEKGYLWTKGVGALQSRPQALEAFSNRVQELEEQLQTRRAKQLFRQQAGLRQIEFQQRIDAHAGRESEEYETQSRAAALDQYAQEAIDSYGLPGLTMPDPQNPGAVVGGQPNETSEVRRGLALQEFDAMASARGLPKGSPLYNQLRREVTNKISTGIAERLMGQDPANAWKYLQGIPANEMTTESRRKLTGQIQEHASTAIGISTARGLMQQFQDPDLAQQKLRDMMLANPGAMTPAAFDRARQEIDLQGKAAEGFRKNIETRLFEGAKQYVLENPGTRFDGLPEVLRKGLEDSFQRDDFETWIGKEAKVETNPVVAAGLEMQPASWWKKQDLNSFTRDFGRHLDADAFQRFAKKIGIGPEAENERKVSDLDLLAAQDAGIVEKDTKLSDDPEAAAKFMRFQIRVDQKSEIMSEDMRDPVERRAEARRQVLSEKNTDGTYRWELTDEQRAQTPIKVSIDGYDETINISNGFGGVSQTELGAVIEEIGKENPRRGEILKAKAAQYRDELAKDPNFATDAEREMAVQQALKADFLVTTTETDIVKRIVERRKKARDLRKAERELTGNEAVSWVTLQRMGIIKSRDDELQRILSGKSLAGLDDIAAEGSSQKFGVFTADRTEDMATSGGLSRAAVERMLQAHRTAVAQTRVAVGQMGGDGAEPSANAVAPQLLETPILSARQKSESVKRFERMFSAQEEAEAAAKLQGYGAPDLTMGQKLNIEALQKAMAAQQAASSDGMPDPRLQALMAQQTMAVLPKGPSKQDAQMAWEAWLQNGGEEWETWEAGGKNRDSMPSIFARQMPGDPGLGIEAKEYGYKLHKQFRDKVAKVLGRNPSMPPSGQ